MATLSRRIRTGVLLACCATLTVVSVLLGSIDQSATSAGMTAMTPVGAITLPGATFDPVLREPEGTIRPGQTAAGGPDYYVVQLNEATSDEVLDRLDAMGVKVLQYVPHHAFFVYADASTMTSAVGDKAVRWAGEYRPEFRFGPVLNEQLLALAQGRQPSSGISPIELTWANTAVFDVAIFKTEAIDAVADRLVAQHGGRVVHKIELAANYFNVVRVELPLDQVVAAARIKGVITIDAYSAPRTEDERAAHIIAGNYTNATTISGPGYNPLSQFGVDGTRVTVSMVDDGVSIPGNGGFYVTAANTVHGPLRGAAAGATGGHGHINASIISGNSPFDVLDPTGHNYGIGVAPRSHIVNIPLLVAGYGGTEADSYHDTVVTPGPNGVNGSISNNSWGNGTNSNVYDAYTAQFDGYVRDASTGGSIDPISLVFSAGNLGAGQTLTRPKTAKNIIATGNSENLRPELSAAANNMEDLNSGSSRGPAADGRIKPEVVAPGTVITGSRAGTCNSVSSCFSANHAWSTGTSHAAPQVAGAAALFTQAWKDGNSGVNPSPALIKAAILNTGQEMTGANVTGPIPNGNEGWGRINMKFMLRTGVPMKHVNETAQFLTPGQNAVFTGVVADATKPIRVALVWTDPPGAPNANPALVNNLDLTVTLGGVTYRGNNFTGGISVSGGTADTINNVEMVRLPAGAVNGTPFTIQVNATALNGDGILGNGDPTDQHFALVAYNFATRPMVRADFDGDSRTDISVYRPTGGLWYLQKSIDGFGGQQFGISTDVPVPGDYDGDGRTDLAVFRADANPANPDFFVLRSLDNSFSAIPWGSPGDTPMSGDFDGDGRSDIAVYRPGNNTWYIQNSAGGTRSDSFGAAGDVPLVMDYEADGRSNIGVFRPSNGTWYVARPTGIPSQSFYANPFGSSGDMPVPGDFDGDNSDDIAVFRPTTGIWYVRRSSNGVVETTQFGSNGDSPVPGDYDGDGRDDLAVFRGGVWYLLRSNLGFTGIQFGIGTDIPVPRKYIP